MAIAINGSPTTASGSGGTCTLTVPAATDDGDLLVVVIDQRGLNAITLPGGWDTRALNTSNINTLLTCTRIASSEPASYDWTWSGTPLFEGVMIAYSGVNTTTPMDVAGATNADGVGSTTAVAPSLTTVTNDAMLICAWGGRANVISWSLPGSMTPRRTIASAPSLAVAEELVPSAGATGTRTATITATPWAAHSIALRPASTAGAAFPMLSDGAIHSAIFGGRIVR